MGQMTTVCQLVLKNLILLQKDILSVFYFYFYRISDKFYTCLILKKTKTDILR